MEAACTSETSATPLTATWYNNPRTELTSIINHLEKPKMSTLCIIRVMAAEIRFVRSIERKTKRERI
jgi:hypothetical protein